MPRKTKAEQAIEQAIANRPFAPEHAPDSEHAFANLPEQVQRGVAESIARDKAAGFSGADLRARYGGESKSNGAARDTGLTGPMRRKVLRAFGLDGPATIARSYDAYGDGTPRAGSAHARNYGPAAVERQAAALAAVAEQARAAEVSAIRKALRLAGVKPMPRSEAKLREAYAALLASGVQADADA